MGGSSLSGLYELLSDNCTLPNMSSVKAAAAAKTIYIKETALSGSEVDANQASAKRAKKEDGGASGGGGKGKEEAGAAVDPLAALLAKCIHLEEIHFDGEFQIDDARVASLRGAGGGAHLAATVTLLRISGTMSPAAVESLAWWTSLARLDISNCVSCGRVGVSGGGGSWSATAKGLYDPDPPKPYDKGLLGLVQAMPSLAQLDLGYGDPSATRYFWDYCVSQKAVLAAQEARPSADFTMDEGHSPLPHKLAQGKTATATMMLGVLVEMVEGVEGDDDGVLKFHAKKLMDELRALGVE